MDFLINSMLIVITNPNILNPGPLSNPQKSNCITIAYQNVQGLIPFSELAKKNPMLDQTKIIELNTFLTTEKPSILVLNETWLKSSINDEEIIEGNSYKIFRLDRTSKSHPPDPMDSSKYRKFGGGVLIAIRNDIEISSSKIGTNCAAEILGVTLTLRNKKKIVLCTCYRVGNLGLKNHIEVQKYLHKVKTKKGISNIIFIGDLNLSTVNWTDYSSTAAIEENFLNTFSNFGLEQLITSATHLKGKTLDVLLTDLSSNVTNVKVNDGMEICKSDHYTIKFEINHRVKKRKKVKREIYNYKKANWDLINDELKYVDWQRILESNDDIIFAWDNFKRKLFGILDRHIPKILISDARQPPWFDSEMYNACREKEKFRKKYKKSGSLQHRTHFVECRKNLKRLAKSKMRDNLVNVDDNNLISKKFYSYLKSKSNSTRIPENVYRGNCFKGTSVEQAELFNKFFFDQFGNPSTYDIKINFTANDNFDIDFSTQIVHNILKNLNINKAMGPDGIHGLVLKNCSSTLANPLSILFKTSYYSSKLPDDWKTANVVPIHKKGAKENVENYRPISLTSLVMKVFEKIVRDDIYRRCKNKIDGRQHGFLPGKSCGTQLLDFCDSLNVSLNKNIKSDVIYFDFAKAFDSVSHDIILQKLQTQFGIDGLLLNFVKEYLKNRKQNVVIGNSNSSMVLVKSGVPQGSILGPLLFVLFINDITDCISTGTNIRMYADDTKIWREIHVNEDHLILQNDINALLDWAVRNCMNFSLAKCKVLTISRCVPNLLGDLPFATYQYSLGSNKFIDYCAHETDLGILINKTLNFTAHTENLYATANQRFGLLKRTSHFVNNYRMRRALYLTIVRSIFENCPYIWKPSSESAINKLETLQKRAIKWINHGENYFTCPSYTANPELYYIDCKQLQILPIKFRFQFHDLIMLHSIVYGVSPCKLPSYLSFFSGNTLRSSHLDNLCLVSSITPNSINNMDTESNSGFCNSYFYRSHLLWNRLPLSIRQISLRNKFRKDLNKYIWNSEVGSLYKSLAYNNRNNNVADYFADQSSSDSE